ncbi:hypothetical protein F52700_4469 [Fusarium sp. NRRL 52700]|nr:hypothetical protein F52700_4469 [Fusarium sp. NRRL 52700]
MISRNLLTGTVVLLAACLANAGPCRPSSIVSSSTVVASVSETATESETATSTASIDVSQTTTVPTESETAVTVETTSDASSIATTTASPVETTTTALVDTTTTALPITTAETTEATTTTAAATTTAEVPEALQSIYLYARSNDDPALADTGGTGFAGVYDVGGNDIQYISFTTDVSSTLYFTLDERTGQVAIGNGPRAGHLLRYAASGDYSFVLGMDPSVGDGSGLPPVDCDIVAESGIQQLQCQFADKGNADFWTCDSYLVLVKPGVDFTSMCTRASTSYKVDYIAVDYLP